MRIVYNAIALRVRNVPMVWALSTTSAMIVNITPTVLAAMTRGHWLVQNPFIWKPRKMARDTVKNANLRNSRIVWSAATATLAPNARVTSSRWRREDSVHARAEGTPIIVKTQILVAAVPHSNRNWSQPCIIWLPRDAADVMRPSPVAIAAMSRPKQMLLKYWSRMHIWTILATIWCADHVPNRPISNERVSQEATSPSAWAVVPNSAGA